MFWWKKARFLNGWTVSRDQFALSLNLGIFGTDNIDSTWHYNKKFELLTKKRRLPYSNSQGKSLTPNPSFTFNLQIAKNRLNR